MTANRAGTHNKHTCT